MPFDSLDVWRDEDGPRFTDRDFTWTEDAMQPRTDRLYADFTTRSHLLPAARPWLYRMGDIVRVGAEWVQILDGFLHVRRGVGSRKPGSARKGDTVMIVRAVSEGDSL